MLIGSILILVGGYLVIINAMAAYKGYVKKQHSSRAPLLGGLLMAIGISQIPVQALQPFWWVPFLVDYGCLPMVLELVYSTLKGRSSN